MTAIISDTLQGSRLADSNEGDSRTIPGATFWLRIGVPLFALALCWFPLLSMAEVADVQGNQLQALLDDGIPLIDVRRQDEWEKTGVVKGSHLLTFFDKQGRYDVKAWLSELHKIVDKDEPFAIICAVGGRTGTISGFLDGKLGYKNVYNVEGGIQRWIKSGRETTPY